jgi:hypothetical protein
VELLLVGLQFQEELQHLVVHPERAGVVTVDLVDDDDGAQAVTEGLLEHEARLRLRAVEGIDQQQHAIDHLHHALHLGPEVGVPGVSTMFTMKSFQDRRVLGLDGDALLALEVHRVHHALVGLLVLAENAALLEQLIHERGFAVVDGGR